MTVIVRRGKFWYHVHHRVSESEAAQILDAARKAGHTAQVIGRRQHGTTTRDS